MVVNSSSTGHHAHRRLCLFQSTMRNMREPYDNPETTPGVTRRTVLTGAAVGAGALAAGSLFSGSADAATTGAVSAADAATMTQADLARANIKHVVFLMMENRSFDHLYGSLSGVRGFDDATVTQPDGSSIFAQKTGATTGGVAAIEYPYRISESNNAQGDADLSHNWGPQHLALNIKLASDKSTYYGTNDNWIPAHLAADGATKGYYTMAYLTRADAPYHYAMADAFTICDNYFCSVLGPTYPNRLMWQQGSIDADGLGGGPLVTTDENVFVNNSAMGVFSYLTYPELLTNAGITWKAYTEPASNHLTNMFPAFKQYNVQTPPSTTNATNVMNGNTGTSTGGFVAAINAGTLPQVSWIFPTTNSTEHPGDGSINAGPEYYEPIITALMESASWSSTALFITWDENDGYFDHVPPPIAPAGTPMEFLKKEPFGSTVSVNPQAGTLNPAGASAGITGPVGLGFRVPNLVISPWSTGGRVNSELFDHTSVLKLVETLFGVPLKGKGIVSDWRYNLVGDLTSCFDFSKATPAGTPPAALQTAFEASQALMATNNSGDETPPAGSGTKPSQETTPVRPRVGPAPQFTSNGPATTGVATDLPEFGSPGIALTVAAAAALSAVALRRIHSGGASDSTQAGKGYVPPVVEEAPVV